MTITQPCAGCRNGQAFPLDFTMAFHPIVDVDAGTVWGYEALVRGRDGAGAHDVLSKVNDENKYAFDQACRVKAIDLAGAFLAGNSTARLSINFMPNAVYEPRACIQASLAAAKRANFAPSRIMFEFTENEQIIDTAHIRRIIAEYNHIGFLTALDDFGAGYAGLNLLADMTPDIVKIDMALIRAIDSDPRRRAIVGAIVEMATRLGVGVIGEGVETRAEMDALRSAGVTLIQGYYFAKPQIEHFAPMSELAVA